MLGAARAYAEANQARDDDAVHPRRRDEPGDRRGDVRADARRVARRDGVRPARPAGRAGRARLVRLVDVDAVRARRPSGRRSRRSCSTSWRRSPGGWACRSARAARSPPPRSPTRRRRTSPPTRCSRRCSAASTSCSTPRAGSRAGSRWGTRSSSSTPTSSACGTRFARGVDLSENGQAMDAFLTNEPGTHFLGHPHTLANFEQAFYRSPVADNSSFEQWEIEGAQDAETARERDLEADARRVRGAADRRRGRRGAARVDRAARRRPSPTRTSDGERPSSPRRRTSRSSSAARGTR